MSAVLDVMCGATGRPAAGGRRGAVAAGGVTKGVSIRSCAGWIVRGVQPRYDQASNTPPPPPHPMGANPCSPGNSNRRGGGFFEVLFVRFLLGSRRSEKKNIILCCWRERRTGCAGIPLRLFTAGSKGDAYLDGCSHLVLLSCSCCSSNMLEEQTPLGKKMRAFLGHRGRRQFSFPPLFVDGTLDVIFSEVRGCY